MRFLKWALGLIVAIVVLLVIGVQFFLNPAVERLRPIILAKAQEILKTPVGLGSISASVFPTTRIELRDAMLGGTQGATISRIFVDTDIRQILSGEVSLKRIEVEDPVIRISKDSAGVITIGDFKLPAKTDSAAQDKSSSVPATSTPSGASSPPPSLAVDSLKVSGVTITYSDASLPRPIEIKDGEFSLTNFSFDKETPFQLKLSIFGSAKDNLKLSGRFLAKSFLEGRPRLFVRIEPSQFNLEQLGAFVPAKTLKLSGNLALSGETTLSGEDLSSTIDMKHEQGSIELAGGTPLSITEFQTALKATKTSVLADSLSFKLNGELFETSGKLVEILGEQLVVAPEPIKALGGAIKIQTELGTKSKALKGNLSITQLDLARAHALAPSGGKLGVRGTLESLALNFSGQADTLSQTLNANFGSRIKNGEIVGVNLFGEALGGLKGIPGLSEALASYVPDKFRPLLTASNTAFDALALEGSLTNGALINLKIFDVVHQAFMVNGSGSLQLNGPIDIRTQMRITREITDGMVARSDKLKLLLDQQGQLTFPLRVSGTSSSPVIVPDSSELAKNALRGAAKDVAQKALEKLAPELSGKGFKFNFGLR